MDFILFIKIIVVICVAIFFTAFAFYPIFLWIAAKLFNKPVKSDLSFKPKISIIISAYNEENYIKEALLSLINSGYPVELMEIIVGSDGSSDNTSDVINDLIQQYPNIKLFDFTRSGKNYVLNQLVPKATSDFIFYMDADLRVVPDAINKLVSKFNDPEVGAVLSSLNIINENQNDNSGRLGETLYQKYETSIRVNESKIFSTVNSLGTLYGLRKDCYSPLPNDLVCDDLYRILYTSIINKRVIFDKDSIVNEVRNKSLAGELNRRVRMVAGGLSTIWKTRQAFNPKYKWVALFLFVHKCLRYLLPLLLITVGVCTFLLPYNSNSFMFLGISQIILYTGALIGWAFEKMGIRFIPFSIMLFFVSMNIGFLLGIIRFIRKGQNAIWEQI